MLDRDPVICAEGYLFELERRGYLQAGAFVPEVVLEHPEAVTQLHRDFVHAGSDVVEALTYYAHREKLRVIGREQDLEPINRRALAIAQQVARETGALLAGDICNTNVYDPADPLTHRAVRAMLEEIRRSVKVHMAALPVPFRTTPGQPSFQSLRDEHYHHAPGSKPFPVALDPFTCNRFEIGEFGRAALALDIRYLGVCCGAGPHHIRALAEAVGKHPPASRYSPDMSKHAFLGTHERIAQVQKEYAPKL